MLLLCLLFIIAAIFIHYLLPVFSSGNPVFTDFILESISESGLDKSGELRLFWIVTFAGLGIIAIVLFLGIIFSSKNHFFNKFSNIRKFSDIRISSDILMIFVTGVPCLVYFIAFGQFSVPLCFLTALSIVTNLFFKKQVKEYFVIYVLTYYANMAILTLCCYLGMHSSLFAVASKTSSLTIYITTFIVGTLLCAQRLFSKEEIICLLQVFLPGLLFVWLIDRYLYNQDLITVSYATGYYVFFILLIIISLVLLIKNTICYKKNVSKQNDCQADSNSSQFLTKSLCQNHIHFLTPMLLFAYHSFSASPMYAQPDQHHHGEQMIPWNQIFDHGQTLYDTYTPVSGLFPFTNGFIQHILLDGTITDYTPAISIIMLLVCFLTMFLVYKHVGGFYSVTIAILFILPCYNRQYLVLPILLLLTLPSLYKRTYSWFFTYIICCFAAGLYYPLYGAGLLIGFLPMAILQLKNCSLDSFKAHFIIGSKTNDNTSSNANANTNTNSNANDNTSSNANGMACTKINIKKIGILLSWSLLIVGICICIPMLLSMLKHILTYSSQTITADGIALLGQLSPDEFLPFLKSHDGLRQFLFISIRFLLPAFGIWMIGYLFFKNIFSNLSIGNGKKNETKNETKKKKNHNQKQDPDNDLFFDNNILFLASLLAAMISLMISYTYTLVRADYGKVLSRTGPVLLAVCGMFIPVLIFSFFVNKAITKKLPLSSAFIILACFSLPFIVYMKVSWTKNPDMWVYPDGESQLVMDDSDKLFSYYEVPSTFLKSEDTGLALRYQSLLGDGFMVADQIHYIENYSVVVEKAEAIAKEYKEKTGQDYKLTFMAFDGQGFFDYLGVTCYGTGFIPAARSFDAQMEIWNSDLESGYLPIVFYIQPEYDYYIFRQMISNGYVYDADDQCFYPHALYEVINPDLTNETSDCFDSESLDYRYAVSPLDFGGSCATYGSSYDSLLEILDSQKVASLSQRTLPTAFLGGDFDAIYFDVDFMALNADSATLSIIWSDSSQKTFEGAKIETRFDKNRSKLLIPMGMNACWSLSEIDDFQIEIRDTVSGDLLYSVSYKELQAGVPTDVMKEMKLHHILLDR